MDTTKETPEVVRIAGREIALMPEPGLFYCLDTRPGKLRAEFVRIRFAGDTATAHGEGHRETYRLTRTQAGRWACSCRGYQGYGTCYHSLTAQAAEQLLGQAPAPRTDDPFARFEEQDAMRERWAAEETLAGVVAKRIREQSPVAARLHEQWARATGAR